MATIYKRKRDIGKKNACWWIQYFDHEGNRPTVKGYTDKRKTEAKAAKLEEEARLRRDGLIDPKQEMARTHRQTPLSKHLAKPWHRLSRHGRTKALHIIAQSESKNRESRLSLGISACKFPTNSLPQVLMVKRSTVAAVASVAGI